MTPLEVAVAVARALENVGIDYFLGGSMATSMQGQPRLTNDLDFVVHMRAAQVAMLKAALGPDFELDERREASSAPALGGPPRPRGQAQ